MPITGKELINELLKRVFWFLTVKEETCAVWWDTDGRMYTHPDHAELFEQADTRECPKYQTVRFWRWETDR